MFFLFYVCIISLYFRFGIFCDFIFQIKLSKLE